jgi:hypothetical protein
MKNHNLWDDIKLIGNANKQTIVIQDGEKYEEESRYLEEESREEHCHDLEVCEDTVGCMYQRGE